MLVYQRVHGVSWRSFLCFRISCSSCKASGTHGSLGCWHSSQWTCHCSPATWVFQKTMARGWWCTPLLVETYQATGSTIPVFTSTMALWLVWLTAFLRFFQRKTSTGSIKPRPLDATGPESGPVHESHILSDQGVHLGAMAPWRPLIHSCHSSRNPSFERMV